ncbi:MAG: methylmalonyl-CoA mutase family protein, partial [Bacteroidota bacterium]
YTYDKTTIGNIAFSLPVGTNFFLEQAKFKAMRLLWFQVAHAYGVKDFKAGQLHIHARGETWTPGNYQPHGNMLKSTTSAMSAIMGGCDALTVLAEDENNAIMSRVARNVSNLLREESHLNKVADPMAGSYALENMVHQLAEQAWKKFQLNLQE